MNSNRRPVVFIHGMWLHSNSWTRWVELFDQAGYESIAPGWPGEPDSIEELRQHPELVANSSIDDITAHYTKIIKSLNTDPVIVGHSFGGLIAEKLIGEGIGVAAVAIDPAQIKGVLPLPIAQLRSALPALANPANLRKSVALTKKQFKFGFGNELSDEASDELFEKWAIPSAARPLFEAATANFSLHSQAKVNTANETRGPLLLISGLEDHTVPDVSTRSTLKQYRHSSALTEFEQFEGRGHSLTIDSGWREVAEAILQWVKVQGL
jgi:pimeloyl-ACP methyl ester carboxylesterase